MKRSEYSALMAVLWFIAASLQPRPDWVSVACMVFFVWYGVVSAIHSIWLERREVRP